jgi:hypothetical protein
VANDTGHAHQTAQDRRVDAPDNSTHINSILWKPIALAYKTQNCGLMLYIKPVEDTSHFISHHIDEAAANVATSHRFNSTLAVGQSSAAPSSPRSNP